MQSIHCQPPEDIIPEIGYFVHRKCLPSWIIKKTVTGGIDVLYVIKGQATYVIEGAPCRVRQGDLLCIPMGTHLHAYTHSDDLMECFSICFKLRDEQGRTATLPLPLKNHIGIHPDVISLYGSLNNAWLCRNPGYMLKSRAIFMLILSRYFELLLYERHPAVIDVRVSNAIRYITDHYSEDIGINDLASLCNLNVNYFGILFKQSTGLSFRQYLTAIRINHAENMLKHGESSIAEIAERCGFSDAYYFSRVYKKSRGIPPSKEMR